MCAEIEPIGVSLPNASVSMCRAPKTATAVEPSKVTLPVGYWPICTPLKQPVMVCEPSPLPW